MWNIPALNPMTNAPNNTVHGCVTLRRPLDNTIGQTTAYSTTFTVPDGVYNIWVSAAGGGGGESIGVSDYGEPGKSCLLAALAVVPGQVLLCTIGAGGVSGSNGTSTSIGNLLTLTGGANSGASLSTRNTMFSLSPHNFAPSGGAAHNNTGAGAVPNGNGFAGIAVINW